MNGTKAVAQRIVNAGEWLVDTLAEAANISRDDAQKAARYYVKHKLVKLDPIIGRYDFKHGAFIESDVIRRAVVA